ncbi:hypothetical protein HWV62_23747 [Athelia sp. TMB]|nr:hypothetical protein HWV62_39433 [Athelia sp. TMB]KAF7970512.1 hypothetical protein HWV62_23747 [Athelia sp. TMB]
MHYLKIARFAEEMDVERVLCLTATATPDVAKDICSSFVIDPQAGVFRIPVFRSNLALRVEAVNTLQDKVNRLIPFLKSRTGPAIIYVTLQKQAQEVADKLLPHGLQAAVYHAGLGNDVREKVQADFMNSDNGIVVHFHMAKTLEGYSQEVGRAGRDGLPSTCLMFLSAVDIPVLEGFARGDTPSQKDLQLWMQEVALKDPAKDGSLDFNHYQQSKTYDIRVDVVIAAESTGADRKDLARASQVRARYVLLKPFPVATAEIEQLADKLYAHIKTSENEGGKIVLLESVAHTLHSSLVMLLGLAQALAEYFGDADAVPGGLCGTCTFCTTGEALAFTPQAVTSADAGRLRAILNACPERDDPRLLARFAFGITSPRLTLGKWSTYHPLFGSMVDVDFDVLVEAFDKECKKAGYTRSEQAAAAPAKRTYTSYSSGEGSGRGGGSYKRGGTRGHKRGRYN